MAYKDKAEKSALENFRAFLKGQHFHAISIRKVKDFAGIYYLVGFYDPLRDCMVTMVLSLDEMMQITHVNDIFWRKLVYEPEDDLEDDEE